MTKEQIEKADDRPTKEVEVPEWGGSVRIRVWSGKERERVEQMTNGKSVQQCVRAAIAAMSIVDENNRPVFTQEDIQRLAEKSGTALERVLNAALELNAIRDQDIEAIAKN